ncbi:hypothetical protein ACIQTW_20480 [Paenarthrobacter sp. NPDC090517]|uniref:hypothetical protein n=1 Tax=Paenarthrobacter sp. NPDC090517 TaxID=3364381 RepID=UPI0038187555
MAPTAEPGPRSVHYSELDRLAAHGRHEGAVKSPEALGKLRVEVLKELVKCPDNDASVSDAHLESILALAVMTIQTASSLTKRKKDLTVLWNEDLEADVFLSRTLLLADHIFVPDSLLKAVSEDPTNRSLKEAAQKLLRHKSLLTAGIVIPIPDGVSRAVQGRSVQEQTAQDLHQTEIVEFVRSQLVLEGPTAREVIFGSVKDDLQKELFSKIWFHARIDPESVNSGTREFTTQLLQRYDTDYDYTPWIRECQNAAISYYVQRTNERLVSADVFGAQYVSASPFEARLLQRRAATVSPHPAQAAIWAGVPMLSDLSSAGLASLLRHEEPIQDLRKRIRRALMTAQDTNQEILAVRQVAQEIQDASEALTKRIRTDRLLSGIIPAAGSTLGMGIASVGGLPGLTGAAVGTLTTMAPYLATRIGSRREASYLYVAARRVRQRESKRAQRRSKIR